MTAEIEICLRIGDDAKVAVVPSIRGHYADCDRAIWIRVAGPLARALVGTVCIDAAKKACPL